uniref:Uncharacterized protein n=1 Tax=Triticum urartu TaxID=4572 RepID=A0A8R7P7F1_TRIUA
MPPLTSGKWTSRCILATKTSTGLCSWMLGGAHAALSSEDIPALAPRGNRTLLLIVERDHEQCSLDHYMFACDFQTDEFGAETLMMYTYQSPEKGVRRRN